MGEQKIGGFLGFSGASAISSASVQAMAMVLLSGREARRDWACRRADAKVETREIDVTGHATGGFNGEGDTRDNAGHKRPGTKIRVK